jgi:hypothetical protein
MPNNAIMLWMPDTCGCVIHLAYDDTLPDSQRVFTYVTEAQAQAIHAARLAAKTPNTNPNPQPPAVICSAHASIGATPKLLTTVQNENQRKNKVFSLAQAQISALQFVDGDNVGNAKKLAMYQWSFDTNRVLEVSFSGVAITTAQKTSLQSLCDNQIGKNLTKVS